MDVLIGSFSKYSRPSNIFSVANHMYLTDHAIWCVKAATKEASWKNIFFIFSCRLWLSIACIFFVMLLCMYAYSLNDQHSQGFFGALLRTIQINLGFMPDWSPKAFTARIIFFIFLAYGLIISAIFQSATVSSMTNNYYKSHISSLSEAEELGFRFSGSQFSYSQLEKRQDPVSFSDSLASITLILVFLI